MEPIFSEAMKIQMAGELIRIFLLQFPEPFK